MAHYLSILKYFSVCDFSENATSIYAARLSYFDGPYLQTAVDARETLVCGHQGNQGDRDCIVHDFQKLVECSVCRGNGYGPEEVVPNSMDFVFFLHGRYPFLFLFLAILLYEMNVP